MVQRRTKGFLIGGAQFEAAHSVVSNLCKNLDGYMPLVPW